jgi:tetratricopeptide (TPR) repeat protein
MNSDMTLTGRDLLNAALKAFEAGDRDGAAALLTKLDADNPPLGDSWGAVCRLADTLGEYNLGLSAIRRHVAAAPRDVDRRLEYGAFLARNERIEAALETTRAFLPHAAPDARLMLLIGACRAQLGQAELAIEELRQCLALKPSAAEAAAAWLAISDLKTFAPDDADVTTMEALRDRTTPNTPSPLLYALAKAYDDQGDVDGAFAAYAQGAEKVRLQRPFSADAYRAFVDAVIKGFTPEVLAGLPASGLDTDRPIFVLGLPRSGTTLVEQILVSHSSVMNGGELGMFHTATMALDGYSPAEVERFASRPDAGEAFAALGRAYLHLLDERFGPAGRVVDKTLNHTRMLGLIRHIFPNARFIWLRRDPADTALSCFRSHFAQGVPWSWSLSDIGRHFADEDRLYDHWTRLFPDAILTVPYEDLVAEPDVWIERILGHCGLPFEPQVRHFNLTQRAVTTTSGAQVRQPIYKRAVGGWKRYAEHMAPFFEAYGAKAT